MARRYRLRTIAYSLLLSGAVSLAAYGYLNIDRKPVKNAEAIVYFSDSQTPVDISERISELKNRFSDISLMENVSISSQVPLWKISSSISAERIPGSVGISISMKNLENPSDAPIVLGTLLNILDKEYNDLQVVSYCDMLSEPVLPVKEICGSMGGLAGTLFYAVTAFVLGKKAQKEAAIINEQKKDTPDAAQTKQQEKAVIKPRRPVRDIDGISYTEAAVKEAFSLGKLEYALPYGISSSNYMSAAKLMISAVTNGTPTVLAVASANSYAYEGIAPSYAKFCAYMSCAAAMENKRTAVIECNLKKPHVSSLFGTYAAGGPADIVSGKCTVWDAFVFDARKGVDIIAQEHPYPAPMAVFSSPSFGEFIKYIAAQYDIVFLSCPPAWACEEWELIFRHSTGLIAVTENNRYPDDCCAEGLFETNDKKKFYCSITRPDREWI